ncbi:M23 family metallopeptidase [Demequina flava]|uniref:M23 family metallopeptidase n=1 Tax=Demequina flava TaxID=1095025 RepID=UPI000784AE15|nr:peptidoglycan DD-metalloendopeptidase family protein [Demequina flava]
MAWTTTASADARGTLTPDSPAVVVQWERDFGAVGIAPIHSSRAVEQPVFQSPVAPLTVIEHARIPAQPWHPGHRGVDVALEPGGGILAPRGGVVSFVGVVVDRPVMTITHDNGLRSSFEPVTATVAVGDTVLVGEDVATLATDPHHCAETSCVHWGVRRGDAYVNPLDLLAGFGPVRLLEVDP